MDELAKKLQSRKLGVTLLILVIATVTSYLNILSPELTQVLMGGFVYVGGQSWVDGRK